MDSKISLPQASWRLVKELLAAHFWATTPKLIVIAGRIDEEKRIKLDEPYPQEFTDAYEAWAAKKFEFGFTESEFDALKIAIKTGISRGVLPATRYAAALVTTFKIEVES